MTLPLLALSGDPPLNERPQLLFAVAKTVRAQLARDQIPCRRDLIRFMTQIFGADNASGLWTMRDAYDALELAQVLHLTTEPGFLTGERQHAFAEARRLERSLPTHSSRSERQVALQQFSTPLALAWLAAQAARIMPADHVLEPSAGTGMLAAHVMRAGAELSLNERDEARARLLELAFGKPVTRHDAEFIHDHLPPSLVPTLVLINPPFSRSEGRGDDRHAGARHLRSALLRLAHGGRCVAIMSPGFCADGSGARGYAAVADVVAPRLELTIAGNAYAKHGTSIAVRLLLFDKGWSGQAERHTAASLDQACALLAAAPERTHGPPSPPLPPSAPALPTRLSRSAIRLFGDLAATRIIAPARQDKEDGSAVPLPYEILDEPLPAGDPVGIYAPWRLSRIRIADAASHPDQLVESLAMASVLPPSPVYRPIFHRRSLAALSDAQLETVILAGESFSRDLPGTFTPNDAGDRLLEDQTGHRYRSGFFIGDGTGVGKGREGAACILDQWNQGNRRAIWISKSTALLEDARRDWTALGGLPIDVQPLDAFPIGRTIAMATGILFLTYATLRSARHDSAPRLQQILAWTGPAFDGVILLDESHALGNAAGTETEFGATKGSEQGLAGVRLQNALPRARIVYVSATGATKPDNLSYAARLGLWGPGTAFRDRDAFMGAMEEGGIAAMEIVARDLKAMGLYTARALSFAGVEYDPLEHKLTAEQIEIYDAYADAWAVIHRNLDEALKSANIVDRMSGQSLNAQAKGTALSRFESAKQRFFSQLLISMKMPTVLRAIEAELEAGHVAVVQLVTTAEAILDRRLADLSPQDRASLDLDLSPRETMIDYLRNAFPTRQMRVFRSGDGTLRSEPMTDVDGRPVHCQAAIAARDEQIEQLCGMPPVPAALDALLRHFGTAQVAEVTGRSRRIVLDAAGSQKLDRRGARTNLVETEAFMDGRKPILVFSDAGGTGRSYHADQGCKTAQKRRIHFLLEPGWRADVAIQGLGRTHRTNQSSPPIFRPVTTDCKGERRFISTIARRLDGLGALTRGQRQTGGQNLFDPADNLESDYARDALVQWYHLLQSGKLASVSLDEFQSITGLKLVDDGGSLLDRLPPIQRWLNRILALRIATQNAIFEEYMGLIQKRIDAAREAGTLDLGVETIRAEKIDTLSDQVLRVDPVTGAETRLLHLALQIRPHVTSWTRLQHMWSETRGIAYLRNGRSGRVALRAPSWSITDEEGRPVAMHQLVKPTGSARLSLETLQISHWYEIDPEVFRAAWEAEAEQALSQLSTEAIWVATGLLLPVWHKLPQDDVRVWRISDGQGPPILGRIIAPAAVETLSAEFALHLAPALSPADYIHACRQTGGVALPRLGGARLVTSLVAGARRLELRDFRPGDRAWLKACGLYAEIIAYKTRLFVPGERAEAVIAAILADDH